MCFIPHMPWHRTHWHWCSRCMFSVSPPAEWLLVCMLFSSPMSTLSLSAIGHHLTQIKSIQHTPVFGYWVISSYVRRSIYCLKVPFYVCIPLFFSCMLHPILFWYYLSLCQAYIKAESLKFGVLKPLLSSWFSCVCLSLSIHTVLLIIWIMYDTRWR